MDAVEERYSPEVHLTKLIQTWIGTTFLIGAALFPLLGFMDYFASPVNFTRFMIYRLVIAAVLLIFYYLNRLKTSKSYQYVIGACATALSAATIELAILQSGGQSSLYYAAMMILAICAMGFVPVSVPLAFLLVAIIYSIYLVPILLAERITSGVFVSNNAFLVSTFIIALILRYQIQKLIISELRLREELSEDKRTLKQYSARLEDLVTEKDGELVISEQKYRGLFENANDGIAVLDRDGTIVNVNSRFCELHDYEWDALLGTDYRLLEVQNREGEIDSRFARILKGAPLLYEAEHHRKDGSRIFLEISSKAIDIGGRPHIQSFHRDITEKKRLQEQVLQSQKMESVGVLAGGIAHDFNNIITAILGHAEVLRRRVKNDEFAQRRVKTIEDAARRAGQMVAKLLSFARREGLEMAPMDLNAVVRETMELLERTFIDRKIKAVVETEQNLPAIRGDSIHLEQVLTNLAMNAMDAMPSGGTITISTFRSELGADAAHAHPLLTPGKYVVLKISDTGTGIPREIMDRIFDPFFTTKPAGKGTGLGLAMVYGIVRSHRGDIQVESRRGKGAAFTIYFPETDEPLAPPVREPEVPRGARGSGEHILAVDDEEDILSFMKDTLEAHGYRVLVTDDPVYAQDLFQKISGEIDLVITDMVMPLVDGAELTRQFKALSPSIKVIGISGFEGGTLSKEAHLDGFIKKPFDGKSLLLTVQKVLDSGKGDSVERND